MRDLSESVLTRVAEVFATVILFSVLILFAVSSQAGECKVQNPTDEVLADAFQMSAVTEASLLEIARDYESKTGTPLEIVIVARAGQDLTEQTVLREDSDSIGNPFERMYQAALADDQSYAEAQQSTRRGAPELRLLKQVLHDRFGDPKRRLEFSHLAFLIRHHPEAPPLKRGEIPMWRTRHMLRPCYNENPKDDFEKRQQANLNVPYLWDEGTINFFADNPYELKARYMVPTPEVQARLLKVVFDNKLIYDLNSEYYNAAASWKNVNENNSNQWILEVLAAALRPAGVVKTREQAQTVLEQMHYAPTKVLFQGMKALANIPVLSRKLAPFVTYHAEEQPYYFKANMGEVISALSVEEFMQKNGLLFGSYQTSTLAKTREIRDEKDRAEARERRRQRAH